MGHQRVWKWGKQTVWGEEKSKITLGQIFTQTWKSYWYNSVWLIVPKDIIISEASINTLRDQRKNKKRFCRTCLRIDTLIKFSSVSKYSRDSCLYICDYTANRKCRLLIQQTFNGEFAKKLNKYLRRLKRKRSGFTIVHLMSFFWGLAVLIETCFISIQESRLTFSWFTIKWKDGDLDGI